MTTSNDEDILERELESVDAGDGDAGVQLTAEEEELLLADDVEDVKQEVGDVPTLKQESADETVTHLEEAGVDGVTSTKGDVNGIAGQENGAAVMKTEVEDLTDVKPLTGKESGNADGAGDRKEVPKSVLTKEGSLMGDYRSPRPRMGGPPHFFRGGPFPPRFRPPFGPGPRFRGPVPPRFGPPMPFEMMDEFGDDMGFGLPFDPEMDDFHHGGPRGGRLGPRGGPPFLRDDDMPPHFRGERFLGPGGMRGGFFPRGGMPPMRGRGAFPGGGGFSPPPPGTIRDLSAVTVKSEPASRSPSHPQDEKTTDTKKARDKALAALAKLRSSGENEPLPVPPQRRAPGIDFLEEPSPKRGALPPMRPPSPPLPPAPRDRPPMGRNASPGGPPRFSFRDNPPSIPIHRDVSVGGNFPRRVRPGSPPRRFPPPPQRSSGPPVHRYEPIPVERPSIPVIRYEDEVRAAHPVSSSHLGGRPSELPIIRHQEGGRSSELPIIRHPDLQKPSYQPPVSDYYSKPLEPSYMAVDRAPPRMERKDIYVSPSVSVSHYVSRAPSPPPQAYHALHDAHRQAAPPVPLSRYREEVVSNARDDAFYTRRPVQVAQVAAAPISVLSASPRANPNLITLTGGDDESGEAMQKYGKRPVDSSGVGGPPPKRPYPGPTGFVGGPPSNRPGRLGPTRRIRIENFPPVINRKLRSMCEMHGGEIERFDMMKTTTGRLVALVQFMAQQSADRFLQRYHKRNIENCILSVNYVPPVQN